MFLFKGFGEEPLRSEYLSSSYMSQIFVQLIPYLKYMLWGDPANADTVRTLYAKLLSFPFSFHYPQKYEKQTQEYLQIVSNFSIKDKITNHNTTELVINAKKCVNMLSKRLSTKNWFFGGKKPSELDATIYAALTIFVNMQLQNNELKSHISECPNLIIYINRIHAQFSLDLKVIQIEKRLSPVARIQEFFFNKEKGTISNGSIKVIFAILTLGSMSLFALTHGLIEVNADDQDSYSQYYDEDPMTEEDD